MNDQKQTDIVGVVFVKIFVAAQDLWRKEASTIFTADIFFCKIEEFIVSLVVVEDKTNNLEQNEISLVHAFLQIILH